MKTANKAIAAGATVVIVALAAAAAATLYYTRWQWRPRAEAEARALEAEAGSLRISDLAPKMPPTGAPNLVEGVVQGLRYSGGVQWLGFPRAPGRSSGIIEHEVDEEPEEIDLADPRVDDGRKDEAAFEQLLEWRGTAIVQDAAQRDWNAAWARYIGRHLGEQRFLLAPVRNLADAGTGAFEVDWDARAADTYHLRQLHECAASMQLEAVYWAAEGDAKEAFRSVRRCMRLRRVIDDEPCAESKREAMAIDAMGFVGLQAALEFAAPDRETAEALFDELADRERRNNALGALVGDTVRLHNRLRETLAAAGGISNWEQYKWAYARLRALREARERLRAEPGRPLPAAAEGAAGSLTRG